MKHKNAIVISLLVCAILVVGAYALLNGHGAFSSERELGAADIEQILEEGYGRDFTLVSEEGATHVTGTSPKLDAKSEPVSFDLAFEHVYTFEDQDGLQCSVWQQYRAEQEGSLAKVNQVYDDYYWQQLRPKLEKTLASKGRSWPGTWEIADTPLHPHLEVSISRFSDLVKLKPALRELRKAVSGCASPRENAADFHAEQSAFAQLKHLPIPLMPRVDVLAARASEGKPFLLYWFTPFGSAESYAQQLSKSSFKQLKASYARSVKNGYIDEALSAKEVAENLVDTFTKTNFYLGGAGPKSSNEFTWSYSPAAAEFTISGAQLKNLVAAMGGYYQSSQQGNSRETQWNLGDRVWSATPLEGSDGSFDEGTCDLTGVDFRKDGKPLVVFDPDTPASLKRVYTLSQLEELLDADIKADLDSGTVKIKATIISGSYGIGLD